MDTPPTPVLASIKGGWIPKASDLTLSHLKGLTYSWGYSVLAFYYWGHQDP